MIKNKIFIALFFYIALFFGYGYIEAFNSNQPELLEKISQAIKEHDLESVSDLLHQHGLLAKRERRRLCTLATQEIESLKFDLEDLEQERPSLYNAFLSVIIVSLSVYLIYKQISRLAGHTVERNSRCTCPGATALLGIGTLGLLSGIITAYLELIKANSLSLLGLKPTLEEAKHELQKVHHILSLIKKAQETYVLQDDSN